MFHLPLTLNAKATMKLFCFFHDEYHTRSEIRRRLRKGRYLWCCQRGCWYDVNDLITVSKSPCLFPHIFGCCRHFELEDENSAACGYQRANTRDIEFLKGHIRTVDDRGGISILPQEHEMHRKSIGNGKRHSYWKTFENPTPRIRRFLKESSDLNKLLSNPNYRDCSICAGYQRREAEFDDARKLICKKIGPLRKHTANAHLTCAYGKNRSDYHEHRLGELRRYLVFARTQICCLDGIHFSDGFSVGRCRTPRECCREEDRNGEPCSVYNVRMNRKRPLVR